MSEKTTRAGETVNVIQTSFNVRDTEKITINSAKMNHPLDEKNNKSIINLTGEAAIELICKPSPAKTFDWPASFYIWAVETQKPERIDPNLNYEAGQNCALKEYMTSGIFQIKPVDTATKRVCLKIHLLKTGNQHGAPGEEPPTTITIGDEPPDGDTIQ